MTTLLLFSTVTLSSAWLVMQNHLLKGNELAKWLWHAVWFCYQMRNWRPVLPPLRYKKYILNSVSASPDALNLFLLFASLVDKEQVGAFTQSPAETLCDNGCCGDKWRWGRKPPLLRPGGCLCPWHQEQVYPDGGRGTRQESRPTGTPPPAGLLDPA